MSVALPWGFVTPARGSVVVHHLLLWCCEERRWECSTCLLCTMSSQSSYAHTDFAAFPDSCGWTQGPGLSPCFLSAPELVATGHETPFPCVKQVLACSVTAARLYSLYISQVSH